MDQLDYISELMEKVSLNTFDPGSQCWVHVTHIISPSNFYVRPIVYDQYLVLASTPGDAIQPSDLKMGAKVVFKSRNLKTYARGNVHCINNDQDSPVYDLFAIDEGFFEKSVKLKNIYSVMDQYIPPLAVHCQLANCKPPSGVWTDREIDAMKSFVRAEKAFMTVKENSLDGLVVILMNSCPDDIATLMALTGYSLMGFGHNVVGRLTVPPAEKFFFKYKQLKIGDVLKVRLQCGKELNEFFVAEKQDYKVYLDEQNNYTYFSRQLKGLKPEDLKKDVPVGVRLDTNVYERGIVREVISENRARIQLIDWGKVDEYNIALLKPMSEKFFHNPAIAIYCSLTSDDILDHRLKRFLYPGYEFLIEIVETGEDLTKPNIVKLRPIK